MARQILERTRYPGIYRVHKRNCDGKSGPACKCPKSYQASVYSAREKKSIRKHSDSLGAARTWARGRLWRRPSGPDARADRHDARPGRGGPHRRDARRVDLRPQRQALQAVDDPRL